MASIPEHIKNLLFEQDCVVVPDFGGFITNFHGAIVHEQQRSLLPPRKRVAFNEVLKFDDGLLASYIARKEDRSREEVLMRIRSFAEQAWRELRLRKSFRFEHLGTFTLNAEGKLVFEPDYRINFFGESYGMTPVPVRLAQKVAGVASVLITTRVEQTGNGVLEVVPEEIEPEETTTLNSRQRWLTLSSVAACTGLVLLSLVGWIWFDGGTSTLSSLNPFSLLKLSEWNKKPVEALPILKTKPKITAERTVTLSKAIKSSNKIATPDGNRNLSTGLIPIKTLSTVSIKPSKTFTGLAKNVLVIPMRIREAVGKISTSPGRYFLVAGGFGKEANALRLQKKLKEQGFSQAALLYPVKSRLIRVAAQEFNSVTAARQAAVELRSALGDHVWVLKTK